ncbi:T9SS type A sorting domain-containing protein, partial [candidate division KSB1 bacterium]|nr:T9SS type A sorting domain-containing protein [candidate division KSB1 bacterium]
AVIQKYNSYISFEDNINRAGLPTIFHLSQNYPNPFNSTTTICYSLAKREKVTIELFNTTGQRVKILLDEFQPAGQHVIHLNVAQLTSGLYFYRIKAGSYSATRKMILMR